MKKIIIFAAILCCSPPSRAQLDLTQCVRTALDNNPDLKVAEADARMAAEDVLQAAGSRLPNLDFSGSYRRQSIVPELHVEPIQLPFGAGAYSPFPSGGFQLGSLDNFDIKLTVTQPLFTGFRLKERVKASQSAANGKEAETERTRSDLIYRVEAAYAQVLKAQKYLDIARSARNQVLAHLRDVENYIAQGLAKKEEKLRVEVKVSEAELAIIQTENAVQMSRVVLGHAMGRELAAEENLAAWGEEQSAVPDLSSSLQRAFAERKELKVLRFSQEAGQAASRVAKGARYPSVAAFGSLGYGKPGLDFIRKEWMDYWIVGVGAEWNIWNWGKTRSQVQQTRIKLDALSDLEQGARDAIRLDVTRACLQIEEAQRRLLHAEKLTEQTRENLMVSDKNYQQGMTTHSEYFDAQSEWTRAQLARVQAEIDLALAHSNWRRAIGINEQAYIANP